MKSEMSNKERIEGVATLMRKMPQEEQEAIYALARHIRSADLLISGKPVCPEIMDELIDELQNDGYYELAVLAAYKMQKDKSAAETGAQTQRYDS